MPSSVSNDSNAPASLNGHADEHAATDTKKPTKRTAEKSKPMSTARLTQILKGVSEDGSPLRWGLAAALGGPIDARRIVISELGGGKDVAKKYRSIDIQTELNTALQRIDQVIGSVKPNLADIVDAVIWAYALPKIEQLLGEAAANSLNGSLEQLARHCAMIADTSSLSRLIGAGELGLVLGWRRGKRLPQELIDAAIGCVKQWCESHEPSIGFAVRGDFCSSADHVDSAVGDNHVSNRSGCHTRVVLASLLRSKALCVAVAKQKLKKPQLRTIEDLAAWVAAATRVGGTTAFSTATSRDVRDDTMRGGLLDQMKLLDPEALAPAVDAAAGISHTGGRIAWQISLPETYCHSELGGTAILLPEWDVRRGRLHLDYGGEEVRVQLDAGKMIAIDGAWEVLIQVDEQEQAAAAPWTSLCEYTDDEVHYLELEQRWTGGIRLQRHLLLIREDRCVLLADAVIRDAEQPAASIGYTSRLKLAEGVVTSGEGGTTEIWLQDAKSERRGLAISLQSNEWRVGPTRARFDVTGDGNLRLEVRSDIRNGHGGSLFAPMWFDFQQRRFKRPRTWRQLTVAEDLRIVDPDEAVAFRVQQGSEQWVIYRMLHGDRPRTFLGKHLLADLFCARFHASDGNMEDLVTVGGLEDEDETKPE